MKLNAIMLATAMTLVTSSVAYAAGQGSGTVTFEGDIVNAPCSISPGTTDQTIAMGQISNRVLTTVGESTPQPFNIELQGCDVNSTNDQITFTFNGLADPANANLFALNGTASGAGIRLVDPAGKDIKPHTATAPLNLGNGNATLTFNASLKHSNASAAVVPGRFNSTVNFEVAYQ